MSILACPVLLTTPFTPEDADRIAAERTSLEMMALTIIETAFVQHAESKVMPEDMADAIRQGYYSYVLGRLGIRPITSVWVKDKYPGANFEFAATFIEKDGEQKVHVILAYL